MHFDNALLNLEVFFNTLMYIVDYPIFNTLLLRGIPNSIVSKQRHWHTLIEFSVLSMNALEKLDLHEESILNMKRIPCFKKEQKSE